MKNHSLYTVNASRNDESIRLFFLDCDLAATVARELRRRGYDAQADMHGYRIERDIHSALNTAHLATRRGGEPLDATA